MHVVRRAVVWIFAAAYVAGAMPHALALGCVTIAAQAKTPCPASDCGDGDQPETGCVCIHYPAPEPAGSLAVLAAAPSETGIALALIAALRPAAPPPERTEAPDPPPPR